MTHKALLRKVRVRGVGPFDNLDLEFPTSHLSGGNVHLLTGPNGSGKTTLLEILAFLFCPPNAGSLSLRLKARFHSPEYSQIDWRFGDGTAVLINPKNPAFADLSKFPGMRLHSHINGDQFFFSPDVDGVQLVNYLNTWPTYNWLEPSSIQFSFAAFAYSGKRQLESQRLVAIQEVQQSPFENALQFGQSNDQQILVQWIANCIAKSAIASVNGAPEEAEQLLAALRQVESAISELVGEAVQFELNRSPLEVRVRYSGSKLSWSVLPDGVKSALSWIADVLMRLDRIPWATSEPINERVFFLFLDEVDIHLHASWQRKIMPLVAKLFPNAQIFVSTHSPFVIGSMDKGYVYSLGERNGRVIARDASGGKSILTILSETFDVKEEFDEQTEREMTEFRSLRDQYLREKSAHVEQRIRIIAKSLSAKSPELQDILSLELNQLLKRTGTDFRSLPSANQDAAD